MPDPLSRIPCRRLTGTETLRGEGVPQGSTVGHFWQWSASDLLGNTSRGVLAEYLVALALNVDVSGTRDGWSPFDLETPEGVTVQVKSAAFIQSWHQRRLSTIAFNVQPTRAWDPGTNTVTDHPQRHANVYVFALLAHDDKSSVDPIDVSQWRFFVLPTHVLDVRRRSQHSITLRSLRSLAGEGVTFNELRAAVQKAADGRAV
jgi:hypothetical protein